MKRIVSILLLLVTLISVFVPVAYAAEGTGVGGDVLTDLLSMTFDGKKFNVDDFPKDTKDDTVKLLAINEIGYSATGKHTDHAVYIYLYNPSGQEFVWDNSLNSIMLGVSWDKRGVAQNYENFELELVDVCDAPGLENVFVKYRVKDHFLSDGKLLVERQASDRIYAVSEVELLPKGERTPKNFTIAGRYIFSGYDKGYGNVDTGSTKTVAADLMEVEEITDIRHMYFRTESSSLSTGEEPNHRNQINAVYFAVDKELMEKYGELYSVKADWYQDMWDNIIITDDETLYDALTPWLDVNVAVKEYTAPYRLWYGKHHNVGMDVDHTYYHWSYNIKPSWMIRTDDQLFTLEMLLLTNKKISAGGDESITSKQMLDAVYAACDRTGVKIEMFLPLMEYKSLEISNEKDENGDYAIFDFENYDSNHFDLAKWFTYGFNSDIDFDEEYKDMKPLEVVTDYNLFMTTKEVMKKYYISSETDAREFRDFISKAHMQGKEVVILRYSNTDYHAEMLDVSPAIDGKAYVVDQALILNFDVIQLTYMKGGVKVVVPVSAAPTNQMGGGSTPLYEDMSLWEQIMALFEKMKGDMMLWVGIMLGLVVLMFILSVLPAIINAITGTNKPRSSGRSRSRRRK